jgi:hypothetical protein
MRPSLRRLLDHPIDYAGLFPPAQYDMKKAVGEYLTLLRGPDEWIVDRFVVNATRLEELTRELKGKETDLFRVTVIGTQHKDGPGEGVKHDAVEIKKAQESGLLEIEAYEIKIPQGAGLPAAVAAVRKLSSHVGEDQLDNYLEVGWDDGFVDAMHDASNLMDDVGFKARTGGVTPDAFPSSPDLAAFISECAALECTFKFTAGLHSPVRHYDEDLGVYQHGFLNVLLAGALAVTQDLSRREIEAVLDLDDPQKMHFGVDDVRIGEHWLEAEQIEDFWAVFGGFGSCSVSEPIEGLRKLGLMTEVGS